MLGEVIVSRCGRRCLVRINLILRLRCFSLTKQYNDVWRTRLWTFVTLPQSESGSRSSKKARTSSSSSSAVVAGGEEIQHAVPTALGSPRARESCEGGPGDVASPQPAAKKGRRSSPLDDAKRKQALLAKLEGQLSKHKELLKKDILKKRAILEKDLQLQIHVSWMRLASSCNFFCHEWI